jgi:hypothetical protein
VRELGDIDAVLVNYIVMGLGWNCNSRSLASSAPAHDLL